jgi:hypothetical protein
MSTDFNQLKEWMPLVMEGRSETDRVAQPQWQLELMWILVS